MSTSRITGYVAIVVVAALVLLWQWPSAGRPHRADAQRAGANSSSLQQPEGRSTNANATREPANPGDGKRAGEAEGPARVVGEIVTGEGPAAPARVTVQEDDAAVKQDSEESGPFEVGYEREPGRKYSVEVGAPGMRTVRIPLPTKSENVGKVVLQPALGYHGRLLLDGNSVPGVSVTLRNESGLLVGASAARSDDTGRFEIPIARAEFSRLTDVHGSFLHLTLGFDHSQDVFEGARARVEGFGHGHEIELQPGAKLVFRLSDHAQ